MLPTPPAPPAELLAALRAAKVPVEELKDARGAACGGCDGDGDEGEEEGLVWPKGFEVDMKAQLLGEMQPIHRQILISTARSDWPLEEVTSDPSSLAGLLEAAYEPYTVPGEFGLIGKVASKVKAAAEAAGGEKKVEKDAEGVWPTSAGRGKREGVQLSTRLSIHSSSLISTSTSPLRQSIIVLPDFKIITEVRPAREDAEEVVRRYLAPSVGRTGGDTVVGIGEGRMKSWPLPYAAIILTCSHRFRDKRCHLAAPLLISQFHTHLALHGYDVDERGDGEELTPEGEAIEEWAEEGGEGGRERRMEEVLRRNGNGETVVGKTVGLFKSSHLGAHKFAGNVIIYFPNGSFVFYGRVSPADVGVIVDRTIVEGKVIPEFLRGGMGLAGKEGRKGVLEW